MEKEVIEQGLKLFGYPTMPDGDGIMNPGGSLSNMYGMVLARYQSFPEVKTKGLNQLPPLACFTSEDGHYSITKAAHWLGLGTENVYKVKQMELFKYINIKMNLSNNSYRLSLIKWVEWIQMI